MRIRIIFDNINDLKSLPDGTVVDAEDNGCAYEPHSQNSFEKTADGLKNYYENITWDSPVMQDLLDENYVFIEQYTDRSGSISIPVINLVR